MAHALRQLRALSQQTAAPARCLLSDQRPATSAALRSAPASIRKKAAACHMPYAMPCIHAFSVRPKTQYHACTGHGHATGRLRAGCGLGGLGDGGWGTGVRRGLLLHLYLQAPSAVSWHRCLLEHGSMEHGAAQPALAISPPVPWPSPPPPRSLASPSCAASRHSKQTPGASHAWCARLV